ncbi:MAG: hypothetical protein LBU90_10225 [Bacteroidales bacterium]|jgi:hypothetical protein|nr:hypothetical protein [Bacteroidales bacterium]
MKKTYQKITVTLPASSGNPEEKVIQSVSEQLRNDFSHIDGVVIIPQQGNDITYVQCGIKVGGVEILPDNTDVVLFTFNGNYVVEDAAYKFVEDSIPANSSLIELNFTNTGTTPVNLSVYAILSNR